jgi:hypothetical protein
MIGTTGPLRSGLRCASSMITIDGVSADTAVPVAATRHADPQRRQAAAYPRELIADRLAREQIAMSSLLTGEAFGLPPAVVTAHTHR